MFITLFFFGRRFGFSRLNFRPTGRYQLDILDFWSSYVPSGNLNIAIEHGPFIVDLPIKDGEFP